ncbi:high-affinity glucose transporter [Fusarium langsethiae]|uniref:High-affinity glucose transporter n=1 Tax=Fusarium langsethiae TaxID=179993 RepID=A0A0N0V4X6_FUSLA|nr:high-affinity glucose transporter [Fusarium langsethiae]
MQLVQFLGYHRLINPGPLPGPVVWILPLPPSHRPMYNTATSVVGGALFGFDISSISAQLGENSYKCYFNQGPKGPPFNDDLDCSGPTSLNQGGITASIKVPINYTETHRLIDWCITHTLTSINLNPRRDQLPYIGDPG